MRKTVRENLEGLVRQPGDHPYDGIITEVIGGDYVHVRLAGSERKILSNVLIADHIDKDVLRRGLYCKVDKQYDRSKKGRFILVAILPQVNQGDYAGAGTGIPEAPRVSAAADCETAEWTITWSSVECTYYEIYWASSSDGSGATLLKQIRALETKVAFDPATPPKVYFAVKAIHGVEESNLSAWVTDTAFVSGAPLIAFGDSWLHGDVAADDSARWQVKTALVKESTNHGATYVDDLPASNPPNTWLDALNPTLSGMTYIQVAGQLLLARFQDLTGEKWRGWLYDGSNWLAIDDQTNLPVESYPIWLAADATHILVTCWQDGSLWLHTFNIDLTHAGSYDFGAATLAEVEARTRYLFPVIAAPGEWYVAGNFAQVPGGI